MGDYADVGDGLRMYYEDHGQGDPVVLLHGGLLTIELCWSGIVPALAAQRRVILAELQGHGRTADIDRPPSLDAWADDVAGLLDHLRLERADVFGFSIGGLTALQFALRHPTRVDRLVLASTQYRLDGYHPEVFDPSLNPSRARTLLPTDDDFRRMHEAYVSVAPDPDHFDAFAARTSEMASSIPGWSADDLKGISAPTLLVVGDTDFVRLEHVVEMHGLIPDSALAVLPDSTHMDVIARPELLLPAVEAHLRRRD